MSSISLVRLFFLLEQLELARPDFINRKIRHLKGFSDAKSTSKMYASQNRLYKS